MENNEYIIEVTDATVRFNMSTERLDNLKEYFIKLMNGQLMFQEFLALKQVDLKVKKGEAWGIIGTNGSGKSTMSIILAGISEVDEGEMIVNGEQALIAINT